MPTVASVLINIHNNAPLGEAIEEPVRADVFPPDAACDGGGGAAVSIKGTFSLNTSGSLSGSSSCRSFSDMASSSA